jgi:signal peptidase I
MTDSGRSKRSRKHLKETNNKVVLFWRKLKKNVFVAFFLDIFVIVGSALLLSLLIKTFLIRSFFIPSGSMLETLRIDDRIVVNELVPSLIAVERGDIVVFKDPGGWLAPIDSTKKTDFWSDTADEFLGIFGITAPDSAQHLVKRVIGIPGDRVVAEGGKLSINGTPITETYLAKGTNPSFKDFDVTVPADSYWVMGDNRSDSEDSRYHTDLPSKGFVAKKLIVGKAFVITWPQKHWTWLGNYPDVFKDVPNK